MAKASFTHSCGHGGYVVGRNRRDADYQANRLAQQECWECRKTAETAAAAQSAREHGLPPLTGSPKQIAWAETIRQRVLARLAEAISGLPREAEIASGLPRGQYLADDVAAEIGDAGALIESEIQAIAESKIWIERDFPTDPRRLLDLIEERHLAPGYETLCEAGAAAYQARRDGRAV